MLRPLRFFATLALCALVVSVVGCDSGGSPEPPDPACTPSATSTDEPLVPLAVGNSWTYEHTFHLPPTPSTDTLRAEVTGNMHVSHDGDTYEAAVWGWYDPTETDRPVFPRWLRWNGPEGSYRLGGITEADTFTTRFLELQYPAEPGAEYDVPRLVYKPAPVQEFAFPDTLTFRVDSTEAAFTTPAGTFNTYVYSYVRRAAPDVPSLRRYKFYYAPGIGPVGLVVERKRVHTDEEYNELISRRVLTDCHIRDS